MTTEHMLVFRLLRGDFEVFALQRQHGAPMGWNLAWDWLTHTRFHPIGAVVWTWPQNCKFLQNLGI